MLVGAVAILANRFIRALSGPSLLKSIHPQRTGRCAPSHVSVLTCCCDTPRCGKIYGRHSKSLDIEKKCCGVCRSLLTFLGRFDQDGTPAKVSPAVYEVWTRIHATSKTRQTKPAMCQSPADAQQVEHVVQPCK